MADRRDEQDAGQTRDVGLETLIGAVAESKAWWLSNPVVGGLSAGSSALHRCNHNCELNSGNEMYSAVLADRGVTVARAWCGSFLTALEMQGCSLSLLKPRTSFTPRVACCMSMRSKHQDEFLAISVAWTPTF